VARRGHGGRVRRQSVTLAGLDTGHAGAARTADTLYGVPQAIAVAPETPELVPALNGAIDELRASGCLRAAVKRSGGDGIEVAPLINP
jgi:hypothetical protein